MTKEVGERILSIIEEYGVYLYAFWLFFDKGEGLRNIGIYGSFAAWAILVMQGKRSAVPYNVIFLAICCYVCSAMISSVFSIEPAYSFTTLLPHVPKTVIPFLVISTSFDLKRIIKLCAILCIAGLIMLVMGAHGFFIQDDDFYRSLNNFLHVGDGDRKHRRPGDHRAYSLPFSLDTAQYFLLLNQKFICP